MNHLFEIFISQRCFKASSALIRLLGLMHNIFDIKSQKSSLINLSYNFYINIVETIIAIFIKIC